MTRVATDEDAREDEPLLADESAGGHGAGFGAVSGAAAAADEPIYLYRQSVTILCAICMFLVEVGVTVMLPAVNNKIEDIICRDVFPDLAVVGDAGCASEVVQGRLAMIRGWQTTFDCIPCRSRPFYCFIHGLQLA